MASFSILPRFEGIRVQSPTYKSTVEVKLFLDSFKKLHSWCCILHPKHLLMNTGPKGRRLYFKNVFKFPNAHLSYFMTCMQSHIISHTALFMQDTVIIFCEQSALYVFLCTIAALTIPLSDAMHANSSNHTSFT